PGSPRRSSGGSDARLRGVPASPVRAAARAAPRRDREQEGAVRRDAGGAHQGHQRRPDGVRGVAGHQGRLGAPRMATLRDIKRRIRSVESTQKITKAMKLVAAAKLRRAQERVLGARPYAQKMVELLGSLVGLAGDDGHPLLARRTGGRKRLVVITADKGLCGAFNSNVLRASLSFIRETGPVDLTLVVVGRKARDFYRRREWAIKAEMLGFFDRLAYS